MCSVKPYAALSTRDRAPTRRYRGRRRGDAFVFRYQVVPLWRLDAPRGRNQVDAIECKWSASAFDARGLKAFRQAYPRGDNYLVVLTPVDEPYVRSVDTLEVTTIDLPTLRRRSAAKRMASTQR